MSGLGKTLYGIEVKITTRLSPTQKVEKNKLFYFDTYAERNTFADCCKMQVDNQTIELVRYSNVDSFLDADSALDTLSFIMKLENTPA